MKIIKTVPSQGVYFQEETVPEGNVPSDNEGYVVNVFDDVKYQEVIGFGGAFTESAAYLYAQLSEAQKRDFMEKYFSREKGIGYNFGRTHINSCDFSLDIYDYVQPGDKTLETFSLERDRRYIIPFLKDAAAYCEQELTLFASPWSPPAYMKDNEYAVGGGSLKEEYKAVWARYYAKYIQAMAAEGITISAISVQNEPKAIQTWESCHYTPEQEREFVEKYLSPALDAEGLSHIQIIVWDHNKERVYDRSKKIFASQPVRDRVWAVGHHWYTGDHYEGLRLVHEQFGKVLISSECCCPISTPDQTVAECYGMEICNDFNNYTGAFCDWNLMLSQNGGPFHNRSGETVASPGKIFEDKSQGCYAPVLWNTEKRELTYTPTYYYIGHFSKFVQRDARRIATTRYTDRLQVCGFENPDGTLVLVMMNTTDEPLPAVIRHQDICTGTELAAHSIMTVLMES